MALNRNTNNKIMYGRKLFNYFNYLRHLLNANTKIGTIIILPIVK